MAGSTLRDVARRAGVSIRTVSNGVNGSVPVSDELRVRVQAALDELDYRPNLVARNLRRGRSGMIALVVPELDVPYFAELAREVITAARAHGYVVMLDQTDGDGERERELLGRESRATMFDGLLLSPLAISADELRRRTNRVPVVLLGEHIFNGSFHHVAIDNVVAAREATEHLLGLGRRRVAAIGDQPYSTGETAQLRTTGYRQALERAGVTVDEELIVPTPRFHRHLGAVDAQANGFTQLELGGRRLTIGQKSLAQQHMHGQLVLVRLQRILQLQDGASDVALLVALQGVLVVARGLGGVLGLSGGRADREQGREQAGQGGAEGGRAKGHRAGWQMRRRILADAARGVQ